jgi:hypothetical protein
MQYLDQHIGLVFLWSKNLPEDGNLVVKHFNSSVLVINCIVLRAYID